MFKETRDSELTNVRAGIEEYDTYIKSIENVITGLGVAKKSGKKVDVTALFLQNLQNDVSLSDKEKKDMISKLNAEDLLTADESNLTESLKNYQIQRDSLVDSWKLWKGKPYQAAFKTSAQIGAKSLEDFASLKEGESGIISDEWDIRDEEQIEFEKLSPEEQKTYIEEKKKIGQEQYDKEKGIVDKNTGEEFSSGEKLFTSVVKGDISDKDYKKIDKLKKIGGETIIQDSSKVKAEHLRKYPVPRRKPGTLFQIEEEARTPTTSKQYIVNLMDERDAAIDSEAIDEWLNMDEDKAGLALNDFLQDEINLMAASNNASPEISKVKKDIEKRGGRPLGTRKDTGFRWNKEAKKVDAFKRKFKNSKLSLKEFIQQNAAEYRNIARTLKYSKYWRKSHA